MSTKEVAEAPAGLEVGSPPSRGTSNPISRKPLPAYTASSSTQDGASRYPYSEHGKNPLDGEEKSTRRRNPCGLSPILYGLLVALITLIVTGAALGGGLGGSLAAAQHKNAAASSTTTSSTSTASTSTATSSSSATSTTATATLFSNYAVPRPTAAADTVALDCPAVDQKNYTTARGQNYLMSCGVGLVFYDIVGIIAYTSDDCIEACSSLNAFNGTSYCMAATFNAAIYHNWNQHANCWLKYQEEISATGEAGLLTAVLQ